MVVLFMYALFFKLKSCNKNDIFLLKNLEICQVCFIFVITVSNISKLQLKI